MSEEKKLYNIYYDYGSKADEIGIVYQGTTDNLNTWIEENNNFIDENSFMQLETLDDYIIKEVRA